MFNLSNRVALVTGSSRGIGRQIAIDLSRAGASVVLNCFDDLRGAERVMQELESSPAGHLVVKADVSNGAQVRQLAKRCLSVFGRIDVLVNNAGVTLGAELHDITESMWDRVIDVNLKGTFLCSQEIGKHMTKAGWGRIINLASTAGISPLAQSHHYVASKSGIIGLTRVLALSLAPTVTVNAVAPGFVSVDQSRKRSDIVDRIPLGRLATPADIARVVTFLATDGGYITGQTIVVDGGFTIQSLPD